MNYFEACKTLDELKKAYRAAAMTNHPDHGGDEETMKAINNEYAARFEVLKSSHNATADEYHQTTEAPEEFIDIISKLMTLDGLEIELCGSWLWIGGNTKEHKEALKAAGCRWSKNKVKWYWHHPEEGRKWHRSAATMNQIRSKYGSSVIASARTGGHYEQMKIGETA